MRSGGRTLRWILGVALVGMLGGCGDSSEVGTSSTTASSDQSTTTTTAGPEPKDNRPISEALLTPTEIEGVLGGMWELGEGSEESGPADMSEFDEFREFASCDEFIELQEIGLSHRVESATQEFEGEPRPGWVSHLYQTAIEFETDDAAAAWIEANNVVTGSECMQAMTDAQREDDSLPIAEQWTSPAEGIGDEAWFTYTEDSDGPDAIHLRQGPVALSIRGFGENEDDLIELASIALSKATGAPTDEQAPDDTTPLTTEDVAADLLDASNSPLGIDPAAGEAEAQCLADELDARLGLGRLAEVGFVGDAEEFGEDFERWLLAEFPPNDEVLTFWSALFDCVDGRAFILEELDLDENEASLCAADAILEDPEVRLLFVYGNTSGSPTTEPSGPMLDWFDRLQRYQDECGL